MDARIKKLQEKIRDLQDQQEELNSSVEDIYNTINDLKTKEIRDIIGDSIGDYIVDNGYNKRENIKENKKESINEIRSLEYGNNKHFIDYVISLDDKYKNNELLQQQTLKFAEYVNKYLPELYEDKQRDYIKYFIDQIPSQQDKLLSSCNKLSIFAENCSSKPKLFRILEAPLTDYHKQLVLGKLNMLEKMDTNDSEYYKMTQWIDNILEVPFNNYIEPKYISQSPNNIFQDARIQLDKIMYGQKKTKQHILEIVAKMISNPQSTGTIFAVEGEPGTGKTTLIKEGLAQVLGLPFIFISLGGAQDASYLAGDNYTYIGSKPGRIIQALKEAHCMNPIFYFDELDKVSTTERGQEIINLLIHITDPVQNKHFLDHYMDGITIDLSRAMFIFSFNDRTKVCPILLDRMEIIKFHSYSSSQKKYITEHYLLPKVIKQYFGTRKIDIKLIKKNNILKTLITNKKSRRQSYRQSYNKMLNIDSIMRRRMRMKSKMKYSNIEKLGGMRYINHRLERIISRCNINILEKDKTNSLNNNLNNDNLKITITDEIVNKILDE